MTTSGQREGELYSRIYVERGDPAPDSKRMRRRLYEAFHASGVSQDELARDIHRKLGKQVPYPGGYGVSGYLFRHWFESCDLRDLLDTVTLATRRLKAAHSVRLKSWLIEVELIFREEHVAYTVDSVGGVHPLVDYDFQTRRSATLLGLATSRYEAVRHEYEKVQHEMSGTDPDYKSALRHAFDAVETLFKLMSRNEADKLSAAHAKAKLRPLVEQQLSQDDTAKRAAGRLIESFCDWIDAAHFYRHGQGSETPVQVPASLAFVLLDNASVYLRWLVSMDQSTTAQQQ